MKEIIVTLLVHFIYWSKAQLKSCFMISGSLYRVQHKLRTARTVQLRHEI